MNLEVREAVEDDVPGIRRIFETVYGRAYPYQGFFSQHWLKRSVFSDDMLMLVAVLDSKVVGTASVVFDVGTHSDLNGEFGRLVVQPEARGQGIGKALMQKRVEYIRSRLHVGLVENRTVHTHSQRASEAHEFRPVGLLPLKLLFDKRESVAVYVRHFGVALNLRNNHPHIIPEVYPLAHLALGSCDLPFDAIVDEQAPSYPQEGDFAVEELTAESMPALLRIERGRIRNREVFGPMRLNYGFFKLTARAACYFIARKVRSLGVEGPVAGAIGFIHDAIEHSVRVFELITPTDDATRFLLQRVLQQCRKLGAKYVEVDVSADAPRLQRTLIELGFVPAAYVPAMVFHDVERLDVVKMVRLLTEPPSRRDVALTDKSAVIGEQVLATLARHAVLPRVQQALDRMALFEGLNGEQSTRLATACRVDEFAGAQSLFESGDRADQAHIVLQGRVAVRHSSDPTPLGRVGTGEVVGELSLVSGDAHSLTAVAEGPVVVATLSRAALTELSRHRPDIGLILYRNFAVALGKKLRKTDMAMLHSLHPPPPDEG